MNNIQIDRVDSPLQKGAKTQTPERDQREVQEQLNKVSNTGEE